MTRARVCSLGSSRASALALHVLGACMLGAPAGACGSGRLVDRGGSDAHTSSDDAHGEMGGGDDAHDSDAAIAQHDAGAGASDAACVALTDADVPSRDPYLEAELAALRARALHEPPTLTEIDALVKGGLPKPPDPRIASAHATLMAWGHDALTLAFLLATTDDVGAARLYAEKLVATLDRWVAHGSAFGDVHDVASYGNVQLELAWFMGNMARSANIVRALSVAGDPRVTELWSESEQAAFAAWAHEIERAYIDFPVFAAGLSNRKATQLETMMRIAELDGADGEPRLASLFEGLAQLVVTAIRDAGDMPEDSPRDKYHPQFFLASALQALELGKRHGLVLRDEVNDDLDVIIKLAAAIHYAADENQDDVPPLEYPDIGDPHANHEIPFWVLAPRFLGDHGLASDMSIAAMIEANFDPPSRIQPVMSWGFNAIATARSL